MSQTPHFDPRDLHSQSDANKIRQPRYPKPETEALCLGSTLGHGEPGPAAPAFQHGGKLSQLSVNAPEFKPKSNQNQGGSSSLAQPSPVLSAGAAEFVPRTDFVPGPPNMGPPLQMPAPQYIQPANFLPHPAAGQEDHHFLNSFNQMKLGTGAGAGGGAGGGGGGGNQEVQILINDFSYALHILTTHPANIREFLKPFCDKLQQSRSPDVLNEVINILYDQSVYEQNFRYTGARVVHFLCQELKDHDIYGKFKVSFLQKCQQDYIRREDLIKSEDSMPTLCGLTMFMGELFQNVTVDASGRTERLNFLPSALTDLLLTLLSKPSDTSIKTICQLLKMAGGPTEDSMSQKGAQEMQNFHSVFGLLQALLTTPHVSQNMKLLIQSVLTLRQTNWGRADVRSPHPRDQANSKAAPPPEFSQSEPVFYNQQGKPISREEAGYQEEEDDEDYDGYELTEEEERDFLLWQQEDLSMAGPGRLDNPHAHPPFADGARYPQWSTAEPDYANPNYRYANNYSQNYDYNSYPQYIEDDGLNDEMDEAYEEFLKSQQGPPNGK